MMLQDAIFIAMGVLFFKVCTWEGMVLGFVPDMLDDLPMWIQKPLYYCIICMTPWWGSVLYWLFIGHNVEHWLMTIITAAGINSIIPFIKNYE